MFRMKMVYMVISACVTPFVCSCVLFYLLKLLTVKYHGSPFIVAQLQIQWFYLSWLFLCCCVCHVHTFTQYRFAFLERFTFENIPKTRWMNEYALNQTARLLYAAYVHVYCMKWNGKFLVCLMDTQTHAIICTTYNVHGTKFTYLQIAYKIPFWTAFMGNKCDFNSFHFPNYAIQLLLP